MADFGFRWYDPEIGRFTQRDPIGVAAGLNLYGYCTGDPVNLIDPWGLGDYWPWSWVDIITWPLHGLFDLGEKGGKLLYDPFRGVPEIIESANYDRNKAFDNALDPYYRGREGEHHLAEDIRDLSEVAEDLGTAPGTFGGGPIPTSGPALGAQVITGPARAVAESTGGKLKRPREPKGEPREPGRDERKLDEPGPDPVDYEPEPDPIDRKNPWGFPRPGPYPPPL